MIVCRHLVRPVLQIRVLASPARDNIFRPWGHSIHHEYQHSGTHNLRRMLDTVANEVQYRVDTFELKQRLTLFKPTFGKIY